ncbi:hypothetical protein AAGS61_03140 [Lysinibacillus sp. KU-BSD001]|uniref:hypothetical protein n=1 Tax=Lysinibacillus sp. KU-BSD001 TaxID=3141328 RepID=UPI0036E1A043
MTLMLDLIILTVLQLSSLFGIIIIVGFCIHIIERQSVKFIQQSFGKQGFLFTSWIGTPVHEFGHYMMCKIFNHKVVDVQWFPKDKHASTLGYVAHRYNSGSLYQRIGVFFISIGPLFSGLLALALLLYMLLPASYAEFSTFTKSIEPSALTIEHIIMIVKSSFEVISTIFVVENFTSIRFWIFLLLAICICTHISLSPADLRGAFSGFITMTLLLFVINLIALFIGLDTNQFVFAFIQYNAYLIGWMSFVLFLSLITLVITFTISFISRIFL